ncbi:MAG: DUF3169 family protein [Oscillospiraceae bacterium]|nr:DUF3169 family protein [Oscillospiraceae bacterium]
MNKEKKILIRFIAVVVLALGAGFIAGYNSMAFEADIAAQLTYLLDSLVKISPLMMVAGCGIMVVAVSFYIKGRNTAAAALAGDEEKYEKADELLGTAVTVTNRLTIYMFGVFGIMVSGFGTKLSMEDFIPVMISMAVFLVLLIGGSFLQNAIIKQVQKLNPEKKGNVLDSKFHREWFDSCDEAEKAQIGHAAYKSYRATSNAIVGAVLIAVFVSMMTPVGPLPAVLVCGIWAVQFSAYTKAAKEWKNKK